MKDTLIVQVKDTIMLCCPQAKGTMANPPPLSINDVLFVIPKNPQTRKKNRVAKIGTLKNVTPIRLF